MKTVLFLLAALATTASTGFAQAPASAGPAATAQKSPDQQAARRAQYLTKELGLTADQQAKLEPILLAQRQDMQALRDKAQAGGRQGLGQELKASQAKYTEQIRAVLTPEQFTKFDQLKDDQRDKLRERRANGQGIRARN
ncbi:MAG TPA: hypothetical protein VF629_21445 [Hymenobacter sp.]|jgi:Spy/CpxP family protein refolding chaperone|uniref:Spy/CpxP family protein refolding chaperone n=1 Tax=Hymenobacter sp. TaxID=1898978 RepID=UPI002ED9788D